MLRVPAGRRVPTHDRLEKMADDRVQDDQPMQRDPEREPGRADQYQWYPRGLTRSQKRRVQRLRQLEIIEEEQEQILRKKRIRSQFSVLSRKPMRIKILSHRLRQLT